MLATACLYHSYRPSDLIADLSDGAVRGARVVLGAVLQKNFHVLFETEITTFKQQHIPVLTTQTSLVKIFVEVMGVAAIMRGGYVCRVSDAAPSNFVLSLSWFYVLKWVVQHSYVSIT